MKSTWIAVLAAAIGFISIFGAAHTERVVSHNTVISRGDPAVEIKLPAFVHYVGTDRFLLSDPKIGNFDACELYAFVDSDQGRHVRKFYWIQFEGYLPEHPSLHYTYESPWHATIGAWISMSIRNFRRPLTRRSPARTEPTSILRSPRTAIGATS